MNRPSHISRSTIVFGFLFALVGLSTAYPGADGIHPATSHRITLDFTRIDSASDLADINMQAGYVQEQ